MKPTQSLLLGIASLPLIYGAAIPVDAPAKAPAKALARADAAAKYDTYGTPPGGYGTYPDMPPKDYASYKREAEAEAEAEAVAGAAEKTKRDAQAYEEYGPGSDPFDRYSVYAEKTKRYDYITYGDPFEDYGVYPAEEKRNAQSDFTKYYEYVPDVDNYDSYAEKAKRDAEAKSEDF